MPTHTVIGPPVAPAQLKRGFDSLAELLAVTLGPLTGHVLSATQDRPRPEALTDAATIARRFVALPDRAQDVGAMVLRNLVWRVHERVGDGGATTAVLAQAMLNRAARSVAAGANAVSVLRGLRRAAEAAVAALSAQAAPAADEESLAAVALSVTGHPALSRVLAEMLSLLGERADIRIEDYTAPYLEREYIDGLRLKGRLASPHLITTPALKRATLNRCRVAVFTGALSQADDVVPVLELVAGCDPPHLLLVANSLADDALKTIVATHQRGPIRMVAVALNRPAGQLRADCEDLALLTGARAYHADSGETLRSIAPADLGYARRVQADSESVTVAGGAGRADQVDVRITELERRFSALPFSDKDRPALRQRIAGLAGATAVLKIGAHTQVEREALRRQAEQGLKALAATLESGVVPGGGLAYARCIPAVKAIECEGDEAFGVAAVAAALEAPFRRILANARVDYAARQLAEALSYGEDGVFDVRRRAVVGARAAGLLDPAAVLRAALETAASGAGVALSTDTVVLKRRPKVSFKP